MKQSANLKQKISTNTISSMNNLNFSIEDLKSRIDLAMGQKKPDLIVKNAKNSKCFFRRDHNGSVAIADGIFVGMSNAQNEEEVEYNENGALNIVDAQGRFICPGLIDGHIHLESTFLSPKEFCKIVALHGTSTVICDPHEIAKYSVYLVSNIFFTQVLDCLSRFTL